MRFGVQIASYPPGFPLEKGKNSDPCAGPMNSGADWTAAMVPSRNTWCPARRQRGWSTGHGGPRTYGRRRGSAANVSCELDAPSAYFLPLTAPG